MTAAARVRVDLPAGAYDVLVGRGTLNDLGSAIGKLGVFERVHVFEDGGVPEDVRNAAAASIDARVTRRALRLTEATKSFETLQLMLVDLARARLERTDLVVALGGGILGDVAGLAAALHRRGVGVVQCPTTLLAMVDASVGGKTAVNLAVESMAEGGVDSSPGTSLLKNAVGAFYQPAMVVADTQVLGSLSPRDRRSGLAECIKHAIIAGKSETGMLALCELVSAIPLIESGDAEACGELVRSNVQLKAKIVAGDERELARGDAPGRRSLNLGHTFAHAIESSSSTMVDVEGELLHPTHGEAVGLGLIAASALARELEWASSDLFAAVSQAVASAGLPTRLDCGLDVAALVEAMRHDKKACGGVLHLVVPTSEGVRIARDPGDGALLAAWMSLS